MDDNKEVDRGSCVVGFQNCLHGREEECSHTVLHDVPTAQSPVFNNHLHISALLRL